MHFISLIHRRKIVHWGFELSNPPAITHILSAIFKWFIHFFFLSLGLTPHARTCVWQMTKKKRKQITERLVSSFIGRVCLFSAHEINRHKRRRKKTHTHCNNIEWENFIGIVSAWLMSEACGSDSLVIWRYLCFCYFGRLASTTKKNDESLHRWMVYESGAFSCPSRLLSTPRSTVHCTHKCTPSYVNPISLN